MASSRRSEPQTVHGLFAKTERKVFTHSGPPIYRVECLCGWESGWNYDWVKSLDGHIRREQKKARRDGGARRMSDAHSRRKIPSSVDLPVRDGERSGGRERPSTDASRSKVFPYKNIALSAASYLHSVAL